MKKQRDSLQFSINPYGLVRAFLADPTTADDVMRALADGPAERMTEKLGFANMAEQGAPQEWFTLFPGTDRTKEIGTPGLFMRANKSKLPLVRLKRQTQSERPVTESLNEVIAVEATPVEPDQHTITEDQMQSVMKKFNISREQLMKLGAASYVPEPQKVQERQIQEEPQLPADIAAIIAKR